MRAREIRLLVVMMDGMNVKNVYGVVCSVQQEH